MTRHRNQIDPVLLDFDAWEAPVRLSDDDFYAEVGAQRCVRGRPVDEREDER